MKKMEFSKLIFLWLAILATTAVIFTMAAVWQTGDVTPLEKLIEMVFGALTIGTGFYYWKAKAENRLKLRQQYGAKIYKDAMNNSEETDESEG